MTTLKTLKELTFKPIHELIDITHRKLTLREYNIYVQGWKECKKAYDNNIKIWLQELEKERNRLASIDKGIQDNAEWEHIIKNGGTLARFSVNNSLFDFNKYDLRGAINILKILFEVKDDESEINKPVSSPDKS